MKSRISNSNPITSRFPEVVTVQEVELIRQAFQCWFSKSGDFKDWIGIVEPDVIETYQKAHNADVKQSVKILSICKKNPKQLTQNDLDLIENALCQYADIAFGIDINDEKLPDMNFTLEEEKKLVVLFSLIYRLASLGGNE